MVPFALCVGGDGQPWAAPLARELPAPQNGGWAVLREGEWVALQGGGWAALQNGEWAVLQLCLKGIHELDAGMTLATSAGAAPAPSSHAWRRAGQQLHGLQALASPAISNKGPGSLVGQGSKVATGPWAVQACEVNAWEYMQLIKLCVVTPAQAPTSKLATPWVPLAYHYSVKPFYTNELPSFPGIWIQDKFDPSSVPQAYKSPGARGLVLSHQTVFKMRVRARQEPYDKDISPHLQCRVIK